MRGARRFVQARLHRRFFVWSGAAIFVTLFSFGTVVWLAGPSRGPWREDVRRVESLVAKRFARVWAKPDARDQLAQDIAVELGGTVELRDNQGELIVRHGPPCRGFRIQARVLDAGTELGTIRACRAGGRYPHGGWLIGLVAAGTLLWLLTGRLARRLTAPLRDLTRVAREIGQGRLSSRASLRRRAPGEVGELAVAVNEMAERIERQMVSQRELLAAVSHEIRTPLARLRVLTELLRDGKSTGRAVEQIEEELAEIDTLVGELLDNSRLHFEAVNPRVVSAVDAATRALERASLDGSLLEAKQPDLLVSADPSLLARALSNLLRNAEQHGRGATCLRVASDGGRVRFAVLDEGPGFDDESLERAFESFHSTGQGGNLGLGLSLVQRIAEAHGGHARASNRDSGGAQVEIDLPAAEADGAPTVDDSGDPQA